MSVTRAKSESYKGFVGPNEYSGEATRFLRAYIVQTEELSYARNMGLADPRNVLWELTPWSFVVDWFIPIGTYLNQLSVIPHLKGRAFYTAGYSSRASFTGNVTKPSVNYKYVGISGSHRNKHIVRYAETGLTDIKIPPPKFVGLDGMLKSVKRSTNAIALLSQFLGGARSRGDRR
jgi:hypothetical protein